MMHLDKEVFGHLNDGRTAYLFRLKNENRIEIKITNFGGIITTILTPDKTGSYENICLGFDRFEDYISPAYLKAMPYFGAIIGRYANRIANGRFIIDNKEYTFAKNNLNNTLHGGVEGFDKKIWTPETVVETDAVKLILTYISPNGEEGFPGNLKVMVSYELNNDNELTINYRAITDKKTHVNFTNHTYFNLSACKQDVQDHFIKINADNYSEADEGNIPTGESIPVQGCMDFRQSKKIAEHIDKVDGNGYDHNYVINDFNGNIRYAAEAYEKKSGRKVEVFTTEPGIQFYTANWLDGSLKRNETVFSSRMGFCFETQHFPDSPNNPGFPSSLLSPGEVFRSTTKYKFSVAAGI